MADHYTCTECGMMLEEEGVCTDSECLREGQDLLGCDCTDGEHGGDNDDDYYGG